MLRKEKKALHSSHTSHLNRVCTLLTFPLRKHTGNFKTKDPILFPKYPILS